MKKVIIIIALLFVLAAVIPLANQLHSINEKTAKTENKKISSDSFYGLNEYSFIVKISTDKKKSEVEQKIKLKNNSNIPLNEIYLSFPVNAFSGNETEFSKINPLTSENISRYNVKNIQIDGIVSKAEFIKTEAGNNPDSTAAKIRLNKEIKPNEFIEINISYSFRIPKSVKNFGYAPGENYFVFDNWYPFVVPLINNKWQINQIHSFSNPVKENANYSAKVFYPDDYQFISNAQTEISKIKNKNICKLSGRNISELTFVLCKNIVTSEFKYYRKDKSEILISISLRESREKYLQRVISSVRNSIQYLENNIGKFPYDKLEIIDVSPSSNSANVSLPGLIRISINLFSPQDFRKIEHELNFLISNQYFGNSLLVNQNYSRWIVDGICSYLSDRIYKKYYNMPYAYFDFVYYYPVYGLNIFFYNEIPIIYTIKAIQYPIDYKNITMYYQNPCFLSLQDSTYKIDNPTEYEVVNQIKPKLMFLTWEKAFGKQKLISALREFYQLNKNNIINIQHFDEYFSKLLTEKKSYLKNIFYNDEIIDNRIKSLRQISENKYEIRAEKNFSAAIPLEILIHTDKGTKKIYWNDNRKVNSVIFTSDSKVYSAEIDPDRKYISDINYSNNSFVIEDQYWGAFSIVLRIYFWIQNALLIMGSVG